MQGIFDVKAAYVLTSETAPVEFEVSELISFSDELLGKNFIIDEAGETVYETAPTGDISQDLGDYNISIIDYQKSQDDEGKPALVLNLGFTNNSSDTANYMTAIDCSAFQDGVELETAIMTDGAESGTSQMRNVRPGAGIPVSVAYVLSNVSDLLSAFIRYSIVCKNAQWKTEGRR